MKTLRVFAAIQTLLTIILWSTLTPRYSHPDNSTFSNFLTNLIPFIVVPTSIIIASVLALIPFNSKPYRNKLEVLTYSFVIIKSVILSILITTVLIGVIVFN